MEIVWKELVCSDDRFYTRRLEIGSGFWRRRKSIKELSGACYSKNDWLRMLPYLSGKIKVDNKTLLVRLYLLPRSKFNLMLGTDMEYGSHSESALIFTDRDFIISKSTPSALKKVIEKHKRDIEREVVKRLNGEWATLDQEEIAKIVWEDRD